MFDPKDIDPFLLDLITELNEKGYPTSACCQGRRTFAEFSPRIRLHCPEAYIYWRSPYPFPLRFVSNAKAEQLYVYGENEEGIGIASICVCGNEVAGYSKTRKGTFIEKWKHEDKLKVIEANLLFIERVRRSCGFTETRKA